MSFPLHKWPDAVDYSDLIDHVEKKYNIDTRDYAGKYSKEAAAWKKEQMEEAMAANGFAGMYYVLNRPEGSQEDWPKDSPEMAARVAINSTVGRAVQEVFDAKYPYLDFWHEHSGEINRGGINYIYIGEDVDKEWVGEINALLRAELEGCPAYDTEEQIITCHIDW